MLDGMRNAKFGAIPKFQKEACVLIRVLIAEDSITVRTLLRELIGSDPKLRVVGEAKNGAEAIELSEKLKPDVISMDIKMPVMNGLEATRIIMERVPTPIVILSGLISNDESKLVFDSFQAGALKVLRKPEGLQDLNRVLKLISGVKVVRRRQQRATTSIRSAGVEYARNPIGEKGQEGKRARGQEKKNIEIIAIGASTGGPAVLNNILSEISAPLPVPILVVQHITQGFADGFVHWLNENCNLHVKLATDNEILLPGMIYIAPDDYHLTVSSKNRIRLHQDEPYKFHRPSATVLFQSVAKVYKDRAMGILLTGMGNDGALGLKSLKDVGAYTIAQDEDSSVIFGMPMEAIKLGAVDEVLNPERINLEIQKLCAVD